MNENDWSKSRLGEAALHVHSLRSICATNCDDVGDRPGVLRAPRCEGAPITYEWYVIEGRGDFRVVVEARNEPVAECGKKLAKDLGLASRSPTDQRELSQIIPLRCCLVFCVENDFPRGTDS